MNIEKIESVKNIVLKRRESIARMSFTGVTPSTIDVQQGIAQKLGVENARVVVKRIHTNYGGGAATVSAYVYDDEAIQAKVEPTKKEKK